MQEYPFNCLKAICVTVLAYWFLVAVVFLFVLEMAVEEEHRFIPNICGRWVWTQTQNDIKWAHPPCLIMTFSFLTVCTVDLHFDSLWGIFLVSCLSSRPVRPRGPYRRHHFCRKLSGLDATAVRQDTFKERPHDAGSGGRQSHKGEQRTCLLAQNLSELACTLTLSSLISAKHHSKILMIKGAEIERFQFDTLRTNEERRLRTVTFYIISHTLNIA